MGAVDEVNQAIDGPDLPAPTGHSGMTMYQAMGGMEEPGQYQYAPPSVVKQYSDGRDAVAPGPTIAGINGQFQGPALDDMQRMGLKEDIPIDQQNRDSVLRDRMAKLSAMTQSIDSPGIDIKHQMAKVISGRASPQEKLQLYDMMLGERL